jgi:hypothetical protein
MPRLAAITAAVALAATLLGAGTGLARAADAAPQPTGLLSWPGKTGAAPGATTSAQRHPAPANLALSRQFFGAGDDLAAAPPALMPRPVPGSQAVTSTATENTASNRARETELETADSAADGPVGGAGGTN